MWLKYRTLDMIVNFVFHYQVLKRYVVPGTVLYWNYRTAVGVQNLGIASRKSTQIAFVYQKTKQIGAQRTDSSFPADLPAQVLPVTCSVPVEGECCSNRPNNNREDAPSNKLWYYLGSKKKILRKHFVFDDEATDSRRRYIRMTLWWFELETFHWLRQILLRRFSLTLLH
jgi:hypothetical protein